MRNYTETAGYYQGIARQYFRYLSPLALTIEIYVSDGMDFGAARELAMAAYKGKLYEYYPEPTSSSERQILSIFPELNAQQAKRVIRRVEKEYRKNKRRDQGRHRKQRPNDRQYSEAANRADRICAKLGIKVVSWVDEDGRIALTRQAWGLRQALQTMMGRRRHEVTFIPSRAFSRAVSCTQQRRTAHRTTRTAAKSGDGDSGDDPGDGQGEPPKPSLSVELTSPAPYSRAQTLLSEPKLNSNILPWRAFHPGYCCMGGRWMA